MAIATKKINQLTNVGTIQDGDTLVGERTGGTSVTMNFTGVPTNYVEDTWTPTVTFDTAGDLNVVYNTQTGVYTRIGRIVTVEFDISVDLTHTTASGSFRIEGLPVEAASSLGTGKLLATSADMFWDDHYSELTLYTVESATYFKISQLAGYGDSTDVDTVNLPTGNTYVFKGSMTYRV